jgi:hypothetical protein
MRSAFLACLGCVAGMAASPAFAQPQAMAQQGAPPVEENADGADQVVGLFGATCLHFAGDPAATRTFLEQQKAPIMPAAASSAFLAGRPGKAYDVSFKTVKLALISLDDGGCEAIADQADPQKVISVLTQSARENQVSLAPLGTQTTPKGRPGVQQAAYGLTFGGRTMHVLVSTAAAPPQAVLTLVPK